MATAGDEARIGGWWKMYPFANDPKFIRLDDLAFRLLIISFEFASVAPWDLQRRGWLYHNESFPVDAMDFQRCVPKHSLEEVETALEALCTVGGAKHTLLVWDGKRRAWRVRAWRKWQDGFARYFAKAPPKNRQEPAAKSPLKNIDLRRKTEDKNTSCRSRSKPRKYTDEQWNAGKEAADYAMEAVRNHTGLEAPSGYKFAQFLGLFCERLKAEDDLQECKDSIDEYIRRLKGKDAADAARGLKRRHMGSFAGFKGTRDSIAAEVEERREAAEAAQKRREARRANT